MSTLEVNKITPSTGTSITLGDSGDTFTIPSGVTLTNNGSASGFGGITMVNMWHRTSNFSLSANTYTVVTGMVKGSFNGATNFGGDMTESSGVFTFPSTGIYLIQWQYNIFDNGVSKYAGTRLETTTDNSTFDITSSGFNSTYINGAAAHGIVPFVFDVTNTSTHKVRFRAVSQQAGTLGGSSTGIYSGAIFIRLGDT